MAGFGTTRYTRPKEEFADTSKPAEPKDKANAAAAQDAEVIEQEKKRQKLFSEILAQMYKMKSAEELNNFSFPDNVTAQLKDVLDQYEIIRETTSRSKLIFDEPLVTIKSTAADDLEIKVSSKFVKADMSKLDAEGQARVALEMAMIFAKSPLLAGKDGSVPLEGSDKEKMALYFAAQRLGFAQKIDPKSLQSIQLNEAQQQEIMQASEAAWASAKDGLGKATPPKERSDFGKAAKGAGADRPAPKAPDAERVKADFDQPIGGILNFYHQKYDKKAVEEIKTKLLALYYFEKAEGKDILPKFKGNIDFKSDKINTVEALENLMAANEVPAEFIKQAQDEVAAWTPAPADFPKMGEIADGYRLTNRDVKNQLLVAQAVIRTMNSVQHMKAGKPELADPKFVTMLVENVGKFPNDPQDLQDAQELHAIAKSTEQTLAEGTKLDKNLNLQAVQGKAASLLNGAITQLSALGEEKAATSLQAVLNSYAPLQLAQGQRTDAAPEAEAQPSPKKEGFFSRFRR